VASTTKAKVYLGTDDSFTVSNSDVSVYGSAGNDAVTIYAETSGVILDQNIKRINLTGTSNSYAFKQTGNKINIYDITGTTLIASVPVRGDSNGTLLSFSDGAASATLTGGVMTLGGVPLSTISATTLSPATTPSTPSTSTSTKAKVFLGTDDSFTVGNIGATIYGSAGNDSVTIAAGISGITLDQNIERINLSGASGSYKFKQTGNKINVYDTDGITLIFSVPVQGDTDGTVIGFSNGMASALLSGVVMRLGGAMVSTGTATELNPTLR